jgi:hypothetical protein
MSIQRQSALPSRVISNFEIWRSKLADGSVSMTASSVALSKRSRSLPNCLSDRACEKFFRCPPSLGVRDTMIAKVDRKAGFAMEERWTRWKKSNHRNSQSCRRSGQSSEHIQRRRYALDATTPLSAGQWGISSSRSCRRISIHNEISWWQKQTEGILAPIWKGQLGIRPQLNHLALDVLRKPDNVTDFEDYFGGRHGKKIRRISWAKDLLRMNSSAL